MRLERLGKQLEKSKMDIKMAFLDALPKACARGVIVTQSKTLDDLIQEVVQTSRYLEQDEKEQDEATVRFSAAQAKPAISQSDPVTLEMLKTLKGIQQKLDSQTPTLPQAATLHAAAAHQGDIVDKIREDRQTGELAHTVHKILRKAEVQNEAAKHQFDVLKAEVDNVKTSFNSFRAFSNDNPSRGGFRGRGRGRGGGGPPGSNSGRPGNRQTRPHWDIPNKEQWKENIEKGWCALHGIRGKNHLLENCTIAKALVDQGKITLDRENMISLGQGTRQYLPLN